MEKNHTAVIRISDIWAQASLSHYINKKHCMSCSVIRIWFPHVALQDDIIKMWLYFYIFWFNCQHEHRSTNELNYRCESNPKSIQQQYLSMIINSRYLNIWLQQHELCESCESRSVTLKLLTFVTFHNQQVTQLACWAPSSHLCSDAVRCPGTALDPEGRSAPLAPVLTSVNHSGRTANGLQSSPTSSLSWKKSFMNASQWLFKLRFKQPHSCHT